MANTKRTTEASTKKATTKKKDSTKKNGLTHQEIVKQLKDPNLSQKKKNELIEKMYEGIEFR